MDITNASNLEKAILIIAIQDGQLILQTNLPVRWLRWIVIFISAISAAIGSPTLIKIVTHLLDTI